MSLYTLDKTRTRVKYIIEFQNKYKNDVINPDIIKKYCILINFTDDECRQLYDECGGIDKIGLMCWMSDEYFEFSRFIRKLKEIKKPVLDRLFIKSRTELQIKYSYLITYELVK